MGCSAGYNYSAAASRHPAGSLIFQRDSPACLHHKQLLPRERVHPGLQPGRKAAAVVLCREMQRRQRKATVRRTPWDWHLSKHERGHTSTLAASLTQLFKHAAEDQPSLPQAGGAARQWA